MATKLRNLVLKELSFVDFGANVDSVVSIFKRADQAAEVITKFCCGEDFKGSRSFQEVLADREVRQKYWKAQEELYPLMDALNESVRSTVADTGMTTVDKESSIRESIEGFMSKLREKIPDAEIAMQKFASDLADGQIIVKREDVKMDKTTTEVEKLNSDILDLQAQLAVAKALAGMSDEEKAFVTKLSDEDRKAFLDMDEEKRKDKIKVSKAADESVVVDGTVVLKSAVGDAMFTVLKSQQKRLDDQQADIIKARDEAEMATLTKRAGGDFSHLVGTDLEKAMVLKHMGKMPEEVRKSLEAILKSAEEMAAKGFTTFGHARTVAAGSASEELDTLAKAHAKDNSVTYAEAYNEIIAKRSDLYERVLQEGN